MLDERSDAQPGGPTPAALIIAELWAEREEARASASSAPARVRSRGRRRAEGRHRALAAAIVVLLLGGAFGVVGKTAGVIADPPTAASLGRTHAVSTPLAFSAN